MSICSTAAPHDSPVALKPLGVRVSTFANLLGIGLTKAWGLCRDKKVETFEIDGCTIVFYPSIERLVEEQRQQKNNQPQALRAGLREATEASLASRARRQRRTRPVAAQTRGA